MRLRAYEGWLVATTSWIPSLLSPWPHRFLPLVATNAADTAEETPDQLISGRRTVRTQYAQRLLITSISSSKLPGLVTNELAPRS
jgi:hypothetical protein